MSTRRPDHLRDRERADRLAELAEREPRRAAGHRPGERPVADRLHGVQRRGGRRRRPDGARRFVTDFRYLTQSAEQVDGRWTREIHTDLLTGVAAQLPAEGDAAARLRRRQALGPRAPPAGQLRARGRRARPRRRGRRGAAPGQGRGRARRHPRRRRARGRGARGGARARAGRAAPSATSRSTSRRRCAAAAPRRRRSRRSWPPARTAALPHAEPARRRDPRGHARRHRLGRAARRLRVGLHAHVRHRRARPPRPRGLRPRAARPGGGPGRRAPGPEGPRGRRRGARDHRRRRARRALRPRPGPRRRASRSTRARG